MEDSQTPFGIEPSRIYASDEVTEGRISRSKLDTDRHRTRQRGELVGIPWIEIGRRRYYRGRDILAYLGGPALEQEVA